MSNNSSSPYRTPSPPPATWIAKRTYQKETVFHAGHNVKVTQHGHELDALCGASVFSVTGVLDEAPTHTEEPDEQGEDGKPRTKSVRVCEECRYLADEATTEDEAHDEADDEADDEAPTEDEQSPPMKSGSTKKKKKKKRPQP